MFPQTNPEDYRKLAEPGRNAARLGLQFAERLIHFQLDTMRRYSDLALGQMRAAIAVRDPESFREFMGQQQTVLRDVGEAVNEDLKTLTDLGKSFSEDVEQAGREASRTAESAQTPRKSA